MPKRLQESPLTQLYSSITVSDCSEEKLLTISIQPFHVQDAKSDETTESAEAMKRYAIRIPSSSLVYQLHRNSVIAGDKQPLKKPRKILVVTRPAKSCMKPVQRHVKPQQNVMEGMTRLN